MNLKKFINIGSSVIICVCIALTVWWLYLDRTKVQVIHVQTASEGGYYHKFGQYLQRWVASNTDGKYRIELHTSAGSVENRQSLLDKEVDFAIIDAGPVKLNELYLVAPLWREYVHLIKRKGAIQQNLLDFKDQAFIMGNKGSGYREHSKLVAAYYSLNSGDFDKEDAYFDTLPIDEELQGAIVTTSLINPDLMAILYSGEFELLPVTGGEGFVLKNRRYHTDHIPAGVYASRLGPLPDVGLPTIASWATLIAHKEVSSEVVDIMLKAVFSKEIHRQVPILEHKSPSDLPSFKGLEVHPKSTQFFDPNRGVNLLNYWFDLLDQIKNFIFVQLIGLIAGLFKFRQWKANKVKEQQQSLQFKLYDTLHELLALESRIKQTVSQDRLRSLDNQLQRIRKQTLALAENTKLTQSDLFISVLDQSARVASFIAAKQSELDVAMQRKA